MQWKNKNTTDALQESKIYIPIEGLINKNVLTSL